MSLRVYCNPTKAIWFFSKTSLCQNILTGSNNTTFLRQSSTIRVFRQGTWYQFDEANCTVKGIVYEYPTKAIWFFSKISLCQNILTGSNNTTFLRKQIKGQAISLMARSSVCREFNRKEITTSSRKMGFLGH